jgi:hypothetical protein
VNWNKNCQKTSQPVSYMGVFTLSRLYSFSIKPENAADEVY